VTLFSVRSWRHLAELNRRIRDADLVLIWFLGRHAVPALLLARVHRIPSVIILGGFEVAWIPSIGYGIAPGSIKHRISRFLARGASRVLTVSRTSHQNALKYFPEVSEKITLVLNAVDTQAFAYDPAATFSGVLHVGHYGSSTLYVKNLAFLKDVAEALPDVSFRLVGPTIDEEGERFVSSLPRNATWVGPKRGEDLVREFQSASIYFQPSLHESFSLAVAEAMSCGCIPVVSSHGALPEVVGDAGVVMPDLTIDAAVRAIGQALEWGAGRRLAARRRIVENFDLERRRRALTSLLNDLLASPRS
jgi:glycosyltransferase involved in cell wall biosynthesis